MIALHHTFVSRNVQLREKERETERKRDRQTYRQREGRREGEKTRGRERFFNISTN